MNKLKRIIKLSNEGRNIKDKFSIISYFLLLKHLGFKKLLFNTYMKNNHGVWNCGRVAGFIGASSENYELEVSKELSSCKGCFIDVGSHIGRHAVSLSNKGVRVYCFEPDPYCYDILLDNIFLNNFSYIMPFNSALSDKVKLSNFYIHKKHSGGSSLVKMPKHNNFVVIETQKLDDFNFEDVGIIKVDVEDAEINVLRGAVKTINKYHPKIIFECYGYDKYSIIEKFLKSKGYNIRRLDDYNNYLATHKNDKAKEELNE